MAFSNNKNRIFSTGKLAAEGVLEVKRNDLRLRCRKERRPWKTEASARVNDRTSATFTVVTHGA